jgi:ribosomal protein S24E
MKITITDKNKNALLNRTEISFKVEDAKVPPSRKEVREKLAALENVKPEQTIVSKISHGFGSQEIEGKAKVYDSIEALEKVELEYMIGRNNGVKKGKEAAAEEAPAPAPKPEATPEAKSEEKPEAKAEKEEPKAEEKKEAPAEEKKEESKTEEKKEGDK